MSKHHEKNQSRPLAHKKMIQADACCLTTQKKHIAALKTAQQQPLAGHLAVYNFSLKLAPWHD